MQGQQNISVQKNEVGPLLQNIHIKDLNVRAKHKTRRKILRVNLHHLGLGHDFLHMTTKARAIKEKIDKLDFLKIKSFCASKNTVKTVRRQPTEWQESLQVPYLVRI